jgi:hypothetical protein
MRISVVNYLVVAVPDACAIFNNNGENPLQLFHLKGHAFDSAVP